MQIYIHVARPNDIATMLTAREIIKHNNSFSCWVVVDSQAYDVTEFLEHHPGGANSILRYAGR